ncbi:MAG: FHA domain-containing protein, partial [Myxococcota bacterium]
MARVNLYRDGVYREEHVLMKAVVGVGRHPDNDIILDDPTLSRFHARIERRGATYAVTDLGSSVGVLLNGQRIEGDRELSSGDKLTFGRYDAVFMSEMAPVRRLASREDDGPAPPGGLSSALAAANKGDTTQLSEGSIPQLLLM